MKPSHYLHIGHVWLGWHASSAGWSWRRRRHVLQLTLGCLSLDWWRL